MKIHLLLLPFVIVASCRKVYPDPKPLTDYGWIYTPGILEIYLTDSVNLIDNGTKIVYIDRFVAYNVWYGIDTATQIRYPADTSLIGSLVRNTNTALYDKAMYLIAPDDLPVIDTNNIISVKTNTITFGINKSLSGVLYLSAYDKYVGALKVSFDGISTAQIIVHYSGNQSPIEVANYINTHFTKASMYGWTTDQ